jgi:hypothetical protein
MFCPPTRNSWIIAPRGRKVNSACSGADIVLEFLGVVVIVVVVKEVVVGVGGMGSLP